MTDKICARCRRESPEEGYTYPEGTVYCPRCGAMLPAKGQNRTAIVIAFSLLALLVVGVSVYVVSLFRAPRETAGAGSTRTQASAQPGTAGYDEWMADDEDDNWYGDERAQEEASEALEALFADPTPENYVAFLSDPDAISEDELFDAYFGFLALPDATKEQNIAVANALKDALDGYLSQYLLQYRYAVSQDESLLRACDAIAPVWGAFASEQMLDMASVMLDIPAKDLSWTDIARVEMLRFSTRTTGVFADGAHEATYRLRGDAFDRLYPTPIRIEDYAGISAFFNLKELHAEADLTQGSELYTMYAIETLGIEASQPDYEVLASIPNLKSLTNTGHARSLEGIGRLGETLTRLAFYAYDGVLLDPLLDLPLLTSLTIENAEAADVATIAKLTQLTELDLQRVPDNLAFLEPLANLTRLRIKSCDAKTISPIQGMTKLTDLTLDAMGKLDDLSAIGAFTELRNLTLSCSDVKAYGFLAKLKNLESADLSYVYELKPIESLPKLHTLRVSWPRSIAPLKTLPSLRSLTLDNANAPERALSFEGLNLTHLALYNCSLYQNEDSVFSNKGLQRLEIRGGTFCSDFSKIANLSGLEELYLAGVSLIRSANVSGGGGVYSIGTDERTIDEYTGALGKLSSLRWMRLSDMNLKDVSFASKLTNLSEAYVPDNRIEDASAFLSLPNLRVLDVSRNALPGTDGLTAIPYVITDGPTEADPFFL